jgi:hypothetical protein
LNRIFYSQIVHYNLSRTIIADAEENLDEIKKKYKINVKTSMILIKDYFMELLSKSAHIKLFYSEYNWLKSKLSKKLVQIKDKKKFPRILKANNIKHHLNGN